MPRHDVCLEWMGDNYWRYIDWYQIHFGEDTRNWFVLLVFKEIIEIVFQTLALYNYNGVNLFDRNQVVLAYPRFSIILFASLLGGNAIIVGILWILYVLQHRLCQGLFFKQLVFITDTIFEGFYALFPILFLAIQTNFNLEVSVGALQTTNLYVFFVCFFWIFLKINCHRSLFGKMAIEPFSFVYF